MVKISNLPDGGDQESGDVLPGVRGGTTQKVSGPLVQSDLASMGGSVPELGRNNTFTSSTQEVESNFPRWQLTKQDAAADEKTTRLIQFADRTRLQFLADDGSTSADVFEAIRNGVTPDRVNFKCTLEQEGNPVLDTTDLAANGGSVPEVDQGETITGTWTFTERSSDPADPAEGQWVQWMSDGTGTGDDGDIMAKITAGGVTKTATLIDFSAV